MLNINKIDISEHEILEFDEELLKLLLIDRTTNRNIMWATDDYKGLGCGFEKTDCIQIPNITGEEYKYVIRPRSVKSIEQQKLRARSKAEVFTPSWLCNKQNNLVDQSFFKSQPQFNTESECGWTTLTQKIKFDNGKSWKDYVLNPVLEVTCGEAPYLVSRYDSTNGEKIETSNRIGLIDRKIRVINENSNSNDEWLKWCLIALKQSYGFELQGDNLLMARENVLFTFLDYYFERFGTLPSKTIIRDVADIISWNLWQMDGIKLVVPYSCHDIELVDSPTIFADDSISQTKKTKKCTGCEKNIKWQHNGVYCKIKDWKTGTIETFLKLTNC